MRNLVVIVTDTLRRLGSVRQLDLTSDAPFLDRFVGASVTFERAIASSPWTLPSHWSLLCGANPWQVGAHNPSRSEIWRSSSLAKAWEQAGGVSFGLSQNLMVSADSGLLADYNHSISSSPVSVQRIATEISSAMDLALGVTSRKLSKTRSTRRSRANSVKRGAPGLWLACLSRAARSLSTVLNGVSTSQETLRKLSVLINRQAVAKPTHVFINLMDAHEPYVKPSYARGTIQELGCVPTANLALHSKWLQASGAGPEAFHAAYKHAVQRLDRSLQAAFEILGRSGILEDALVCLVSDHGQSLGENGFFGHGWSLFDEVVRIPAYFWYSRGHQGSKGPYRIQDWVDHRHLHDVLMDQVNQSDKPIEISVRESLIRRGPAISYFQGRRLSGFNPADRLASYERIRVWQNDSHLEYYRGSKDSEASCLSKQGGDSSELEAVVDRVFRETRRSSQEPGEFVECSEISNRLASWGYA